MNGGIDLASWGQASYWVSNNASSLTAELTVPMTVVRGAPGPTLFVTATVHGDELNGVGILRGLLNDTDFSGLKGTLIAVPVVNVPGFLNQDRRLPDRRGANRPPGPGGFPPEVAPHRGRP